MPTSSEILDASRDAAIRERLTALRPAHVTEQQVWDSMSRLVRADLDGAGASIATVFRYALGQAGLDAGKSGQYVTDAHLTAALSEVFPEAG